MPICCDLPTCHVKNSAHDIDLVSADCMKCSPCIACVHVYQTPTHLLFELEPCFYTLTRQPSSISVCFVPSPPLRALIGPLPRCRTPPAVGTAGCCFVMFALRSAAEAAIRELHNTHTMPSWRSPIQISFAKAGRAKTLFAFAHACSPSFRGEYTTRARTRTRAPCPPRRQHRAFRQALIPSERVSDRPERCGGSWCSEWGRL